MALSQADFYAYSRATGAPVPEDPRERAEMAPEVLAFRRNQLKAPEQQGPDPVSVGIGVGLALAGAGGALFGARRLMRGPKQSATAGVRQVNLAEMAGPNAPVRRVATEPTPEPSKTVSSTGLSPVDLAEEEYVSPYSKNPTYRDVYPSRFEYPPISKETIAARRQAETQKGIAAFKSQPETYQLELKGEVSPTLRSIRSLEIGPNLTQIRRKALGLAEETVPKLYPFPTSIPLEEAPKQLNIFSPRSYLEQKGSLAPVEDLTSVQQQSLPQVIDQKINAVESGVNQQELKNSIEIQRNEDIDMSSAQRFFQRERDEIASQLGEQGLNITPSAIEQELSNRLGSSAYTYGPKYTARKQALELYAQTGNPILTEKVQRFGLSPVTFETFENMPAAKQAGFEASPPFSTSYYPSEELIPVGLTSNINIDVPTKGQVSLASLRTPVITETTAQAAEHYYQTKKEKALNWLGDLRVELEPKRNQILKERRALVEQSAQEIIPRLQAARQNGQTTLVKELEGNLENLRTLYRNPQLGTHRADELNALNAQIEGAQSKILQSIAGIQKKYPTTLSDWSGESSRVFGEVDVNTGELIPETIEIRSGRPTQTTAPKGGGGRNIAEYTAGERLDEEIRAIQGGGRIRDYDETGAAYFPWKEDSTQTGREIDIYGIRPSTEKRADPSKRPSQPQYTKQEITEEAMRLSQSDPYGDVPLSPEYSKVVELLGSQEATPERKASVLLSEQVRKGQLQFPKQNLGPYPSMLLTSKPMTSTASESIVTQQPVQLSLPSDIVPEAGRARVRQTSADAAANQLEAYMSRLKRGRSTPLTSAVRIQPTLF